MKYVQPYGITDPEAPYINGDPSRAIQGSIPPAAVFENPQREIVAVIESGGIIPADNDLTQMLRSIRSQRMNYALALNTTTGEENAITVEFDPPVADTMTPGMPIRVKVAQDTTGPCSLETDGVQHPLRRMDGSELESGDLLGGTVFEAVWNDTYWEIVNFRAAGGGTGGGTINNYITKIPYAVDTGPTANHLIAAFTPAITTLTPGDLVEVKLANTVTGATDIVVNALAAKSIVRGNGQPLQANDAVTGQIMLLSYRDDGQFQFTGIIPQSFSGYGLPIGCIVLVLGNVAIPGTIKLNGALITRVAHPGLWTYANGSNRIVNESEWQTAGQRLWTAFSRGDGSSNFRLPDFRAEFLRFWDDGRGVDSGRLLTMQQKDQVGEFSVSGTITMNNIIATAVPGEYSIPQPGFPVAWSELPGTVATQAGGDTPAWGLKFSRVGSLQGTGAFSGNSGLETRTRNTVVTACIVDG